MRKKSNDAQQIVDCELSVSCMFLASDRGPEKFPFGLLSMASKMLARHRFARQVLVLRLPPTLVDLVDVERLSGRGGRRANRLPRCSVMHCELRVVYRPPSRSNASTSRCRRGPRAAAGTRGRPRRRPPGGRFSPVRRSAAGRFPHRPTAA